MVCARTPTRSFAAVPNIRWLLAAITASHRWIYVNTRGWVGRFLGLKKRALLLWHIGRKSGNEYSVPLLYIEDGERFIVAGSNAGDSRDPQWWKNLQAHPETRVWVGHRKYAVCARHATEAESERLWPILQGHYRFFEAYRERAGREIPIVLLEPSDPQDLP